jgi:hypothetical protein
MPDVLHFRGNIIPFDSSQMIGPDFGRRYLAIRTATYDPTTDISTVVLRGILPDEYRERVTALVAKERERVRIRELFNG